MSHNFNEDSHSKGKQFENFVQNVLFPSSHYKILHKTNDFEQNSERFVASTLEPDFKIQSLVTGEEFYVEAKYRSKTFNNRYDILSNQQLASFPELSENTPIYIAFGYGGEASEPEFVSLLPYSKQIEKTMAPEEVFVCSIEKNAVQISELPKVEYSENKTNEFSVEKTKSDSSQEGSSQKNASSKSNQRTKNVLTGAALIGIILIALSSFLMVTHEDEIDYNVHLPDKIMRYYKIANNYEFDLLIPFFDNRVNWYGAAKLKPEEVIASVKKDFKRMPFIQSIVDPESFKIIKQEDGDYHVTYDMVYKEKRKKILPYTVYNLKIVTYWDPQFNLKSISEIREK